MTTKNIEEHSDWYHDIPTMKTLILGSFPPHKTKQDYPFYYPNSLNRFWKILADINGYKLQYFKNNEAFAVQERQKIMEQLCVGVQNVGLKIMRKGTSAKDTSINILEYQDIFSIIRKHKELQSILLSGFSAENSTLRSFERYLQHQNIQVPDYGKASPEKSFKIKIDDREIECVILNSTSTASRVSYETVLQQFKNWIL